MPGTLDRADTQKTNFCINFHSNSVPHSSLAAQILLQKQIIKLLLLDLSLQSSCLPQKKKKGRTKKTNNWQQSDSWSCQLVWHQQPSLICQPHRSARNACQQSSCVLQLPDRLIHVISRDQYDFTKKAIYRFPPAQWNEGMCIFAVRQEQQALLRAAVEPRLQRCLRVPRVQPAGSSMPCCAGMVLPQLGKCLPAHRRPSAFTFSLEAHL